MTDVPSNATKLKVFISYSRRDMTFADRLVTALTDRGFDVLIDRRDLPKLEDWRRELLGFIRQADTIIFIVSHYSLSSEVVAWEIDQVRSHAKRLAPVIIADVDDLALPYEIARINHIKFTDTGLFEQRANELAHALNSDVAWLKEHTRLADMARRWTERGKPDDLLIRGQDIDDADAWAARRPREAPIVTEDQQEFIRESRKAEQRSARVERRRTRLIALISLGAMIVVSALGWFFFQSSQEALRSQSEYLADLSRQQLGAGDIVTAELLALEGLRDRRSSIITQRVRPYAPAAEGALDLAWRAWQSGQWTERTLLRDHERWAFSAAFSPNGRVLATASLDSTGRLWDADTGAEIAVLRGHGDAVHKISFSPDGKLVATASSDKTARVWEVPSGKLLATLTGHQGGVYDVTFSPDGSIIATAAQDKTARLWETSSGNQVAVLDGHGGILWRAIFSPDGQFLATCSNDKTVRLWSVASRLPIQTMIGHKAGITNIAFSPDGALIASASGDHTARLWAVASGEATSVLEGHADGVQGIAFSPDGRTLATASLDHTARLWDVATGQLSHTLLGHAAYVNRVVFSPDGRYLVSSSQDNTARIWDPLDGRHLATLAAHAGWVSDTAFSPGGKLLVTTSRDRTVRIWEHRMGASPTTLVAPPYMPTGLTIMRRAISSDARIVALAYGARPARIAAWDANTGQLVSSFDGPHDVINTVAVTPDGRLIAAASADKTARLWDAATGKELAMFTEHEGEVTNVAFSHDGRYLATTGSRAGVRIFDAATHALVSVVPSGLGGAVAFSHDGQLIAISQSGKIYLWNLRTLSAVGLISGHPRGVGLIAFSPDDRKLIGGSSVADGIARLWDVATENEIALMGGHEQSVDAIAFSPDGRLIATASMKSIRLWDAASGRAMSTFVGSEGIIDGLAFTPDSRRLLSASSDQTVHSWPIQESTQGLIDLVRATAPRCLSPDQRIAFHLPALAPRWCNSKSRWPYLSAGSPPFGPEPAAFGERVMSLVDGMVAAGGHLTRRSAR